MADVNEKIADIRFILNQLINTFHFFAVVLLLVSSLESLVFLQYLFIALYSMVLFTAKLVSAMKTGGSFINNNKACLAYKGLSFIPKPVLSMATIKEIVHLDVRNNDIKKIDIDLTLLVNVKTVDISGNELNYVHLSSLRLPKKLEDIRIEFNSLENIEISSRTLKRIYARGNSLCLFNCIESNAVSHLDVSFNSITILHSSINEMKNLKWLNLEGNLISSLPNEFCKLNKLAFLNLTGNNLETLPIEFSSMNCLETAELKLEKNKLVFPPQSVCDNGFLKIRKYIIERVKKRETHLNGIHLKVAVVMDDAFVNREYRQRAFEQLEDKSVICFDSFGNKLSISKHYITTNKRELREKSSDFDLFTFLVLEEVTIEKLKTLFSAMSNLRKHCANCKIAVVCKNLAPFFRLLHMDNTRLCIFEKLAKTMQIIQEKIKELKSTKKHTTSLDRIILESLYLARAKYQTRLPGRSDTIWFFQDPKCIITDTDQIVEKLVAISSFSDLYGMHGNTARTTASEYHETRDISWPLELETEFKFKIKTIYETISRHLQIGNFIIHEFQKDLKGISVDRIAVKNEEGLLKVRFLDDGNIEVLSEGNDLNAVWKGTIRMNKLILATLDNAVSGAWIICPNCSNKNRNRPCKWPIELLELDAPQCRSYTGCDQESQSFVIPMSLIYPMHKVGQIWEDWQKLVVLPQAENAIIYPAFEHTNPERQLILVLSRQWLEPEQLDIKTEVKVVSTRRSREAIKINDFMKSHKDSTFPKDLGLKEKLSRHCDRLFMEHSNLNVIKCSRFKSFQNGERIVQPPVGACIVFLCDKKGYIPVGETEFPKAIEGIPTDVRDGSFCMSAMRSQAGIDNISRVDGFNDPLTLGCSISRQDIDDSFGTIGAFVEDRRGKKCFLTCCHVFMNKHEMPSKGVDIVQPSGMHFNDWNSTTDGVAQTERATKERKKELICGKLKEFTFDNIAVGGTEYAMDVAVVEVTRRMPTTLRFAEMTHSIFNKLFKKRQLNPSQLHMDGGLVCSTTDLVNLKEACVFKCGAQTKMRIGDIDILKDEHNCKYVRMANEKLTYKCYRSFTGKNLIFARKVENEDTFVERGDSGAVVFHITRDQKLEAVGMVVGIIDEDLTFMIMPLKPILEHFKLKMLKMEK